MGEYADLFIDNLMFGGLNPWGGKSRGGHKPTRVKCDTCGCTVKWLEDSSGWYLAEYNDGEWIRHACRMGKFPKKPVFTPERAYAALVMLKIREIMSDIEVGMPPTEAMARQWAIEELKKNGQIPEDYEL